MKEGEEESESITQGLLETSGSIHSPPPPVGNFGMVDVEERSQPTSLDGGAQLDEGELPEEGEITDEEEEGGSSSSAATGTGGRGPSLESFGYQRNTGIQERMPAHQHRHSRFSQPPYVYGRGRGTYPQFQRPPAFTAGAKNFPPSGHMSMQQQPKGTGYNRDPHDDRFTRRNFGPRIANPPGQSVPQSGPTSTSWVGSTHQRMPPSEADQSNAPARGDADKVAIKTEQTSAEHLPPSSVLPTHEQSSTAEAVEAPTGVVDKDFREAPVQEGDSGVEDSDHRVEVPANNGQGGFEDSDLRSNSQQTPFVGRRRHLDTPPDQLETEGNGEAGGDSPYHKRPRPMAQYEQGEGGSEIPAGDMTTPGQAHYQQGYPHQQQQMGTPYGGPPGGGGRPPQQQGFRPPWAHRTICKFFRDGFCREGDQCTFSHNAMDAHKRPELCKFYQHGFCKKGLACMNLHGEYPCKAFHKGECSKENCQYSHQPLNEFTRPIFEQMLRDEELAAQVSMPTQPQKRRVLLPQGPADPSFIPDQMQLPPTQSASSSTFDPSQPTGIPPPSVVVPTLSSGPQTTFGFFNPVPSSQQMTMIPPPAIQSQMPQQQQTAQYPANMQVPPPGMYGPPNLQAPPPPPPLPQQMAAPPSMEKAQECQIKAEPSVKQTSTAAGLSEGGAGGISGGGMGFNIAQMLERITQQGSTPQEIDDSPASPPPLSSGRQERKMKVIPAATAKAWKLVPIDIDQDEQLDVAFDSLKMAQKTSSSGLTDPRLKRLAEKQFDQVSKQWEQRNASGLSAPTQTTSRQRAGHSSTSKTPADPRKQIKAEPTLEEEYKPQINATSQPTAEEQHQKLLLQSMIEQQTAAHLAGSHGMLPPIGAQLQPQVEQDVDHRDPSKAGTVNVSSFPTAHFPSGGVGIQVPPPNFILPPQPFSPSFPPPVGHPPPGFGMPPPHMHTASQLQVPTTSNAQVFLGGPGAGAPPRAPFQLPAQQPFPIPPPNNNHGSAGFEPSMMGGGGGRLEGPPANASFGTASGSGRAGGGDYAAKDGRDQRYRPASRGGEDDYHRSGGGGGRNYRTGGPRGGRSTHPYAPHSSSRHHRDRWGGGSSPHQSRGRRGGPHDGDGNEGSRDTRGQCADGERRRDDISPQRRRRSDSPPHRSPHANEENGNNQEGGESRGIAHEKVGNTSPNLTTTNYQLSPEMATTATRLSARNMENDNSEERRKQEHEGSLASAIET